MRTETGHETYRLAEDSFGLFPITVQTAVNVRGVLAIKPEKESSYSHLNIQQISCAHSVVHTLQQLTHNHKQH